MEIVEVAGSSYPDARELPNKNRRYTSGRYKSSQSGNSGGNKRKTSHVAKGAGLHVVADAMKAAREQTAENKMILVIDGAGKRHWRKVREYHGVL